jgi:2-polyprenyl-3-methyl-5-hydroxy-6-metoxy-1,4-benzoquinol methylase
MLNSIKRVARQSKLAIICHKIYRNWRMQANYSKGAIEASIGSTHSQKTIAESLAYINSQYDDYLRYAELDPDQIEGKRILELGCGDNVGVALRFLAEGAAEVICLDKFYSVRDKENERQIYIELRQHLSPAQKQAFDKVIKLTEGIAIDEQRLRCVYGMELDQFADERDCAGSFDIVLSRAVIEEIYDPDSIFYAADKLLKPGGLMSHKIDLSDYGMFSNAGMNPLTFLTIPESIYRRMASESGLPNRRLNGYYRTLLAEIGYDTSVFVSSILGAGDIVPHKQKIRLNVDYGERELSVIRSIRPKLSSPFAQLSDEELLVSGIFLVARKPMESGRPSQVA